MEKRFVLLPVVLSLLLCLLQNTACADSDQGLVDSLAELRTNVPESSVTEIDLGPILGDAYCYRGIWMLNADICVILRESSEDKSYEIILLDLRDFSVLSRTSVPHADNLNRQGEEDGAFYLLFAPKDEDWGNPARPYIKASISPDGAVDISVSPGGRMVMPDGKTAIREGDIGDGNLYAVDLATGEEELLIQGVPWMNYEAYLEYVPCWNDYGYNEGDTWGDWWDDDPWDDDPWASPRLIPYPMSEDDFQDFFPYCTFFLFRNFNVYKPLDAHRFVYQVYGYEEGMGFGVYDLQTRTDHRITGRGYFFGVAGDTLIGETLKADANTYEASLLPESVREQLTEIYTEDYGEVDYAFSPDGRLLALTGMKTRNSINNRLQVEYGYEPMYSEANAVTITNIRTGDIIKAYDIDNPFAFEHAVAFRDNTRFVVFYAPDPTGTLGSAYIYLFNLEE